MTDMRDARFQKALQEAPDAGARPAPQVGQAIRDAARNALPTPPGPLAMDPWWLRLWRSTAMPAAPWNAAFATLLVAVLVTVMWVREPVQDAQPFADSAAQLPAAKGESAPAPAPAPASVPMEQSRSASARISAAPAPVQVPAPSKVAQAVLPAAPLADQALAANKATGALATEEQLQRDRLEKDASAEARLSRADVARAAAPAMPSAPAARSVAPATMAKSSADQSGLEDWTAIQIQTRGRLVTLDREQAQSLFAAVVRLVRQMRQTATDPRTSPALPAPEPTMRLTVVSQGPTQLQTQAVMVLWDDTVLWQRPMQDDVLARVPAADVQALLQLARQSIRTDVPD